MELKFSITTEKVLKWLLLFLAFTPLVVTSFAMFPFVIGKTVFFRSLVAVFWILFSYILIRARQNHSEWLSRFDFNFVKNPIFLSLFVFLLLGIISTIFSPAPSKAFFGTLERGEGYIQLFFLSLLFVAAFLVFKWREWMSFFKLTVLTGIIIAGDTIIDFMRVGGRPNGSFINNPAFISAYILFVLFAALVLITRSRKKAWRYAAYLGIVLSVVTLGITNTRGALVGLLAGVVAVLIYGLIKGKGLRIHLLKKRIDVRIFSASILILLVLSLLTFIFTIDSPIWKTVPGLDRLSEVSLEDATTQSRLVTMRTALRSVNPRTDGIYTFLFGYGQDNFNIAYNSHYDPSVQRYEELWFDRAHNKVLGVFVMQGLFGLLAYLSIWYFVVRSAINYSRTRTIQQNAQNDNRDSTRYFLSASILFFAVAYFVQNLFLFDQATTYVPIFMFWAFVAYLHQKTKLGETVGRSVPAITLKYTSSILAVVSVILVVLYSFIPFYQTTRFISALKTRSVITLFDSLDDITRPYNFAQPEIRFRVLDAASALIDVDGAEPFIERALLLQEEVLTKEPLEPRYFQVVGFVYDSVARIQDKPELYPRAEERLREAMALAPGRQEIQFLLAQNLLSQGRLEEARELAIEMLAVAPDAPKGRAFYTVIIAPIDWDNEYETLDMMYSVYIDEGVVSLDFKNFTFIRNGYNSYLKYFFEMRDTEAFVNTLEQVLEIELFLAPAQQAQLEAGLIKQTYEIRAESIEDGIRGFKSGGWDSISLQ